MVGVKKKEKACWSRVTRKVAHPTHTTWDNIFRPDFFSPKLGRHKQATKMAAALKNDPSVHSRDGGSLPGVKEKVGFESRPRECVDSLHGWQDRVK